MYFEFRDALLHTSVVMSGSLNYCCLPISPKLSGHSPLTSGINEGFLLKELLLTGYFLNLTDACVGKPRYQQFLEYSDKPHSHCPLPLSFNLNFNRLSACPNSSTCCLVIGCLDISLDNQFNGWLVNVCTHEAWIPAYQTHIYSYTFVYTA